MPVEWCLVTVLDRTRWRVAAAPCLCGRAVCLPMLGMASLSACLLYAVPALPELGCNSPCSWRHAQKTYQTCKPARHRVCPAHGRDILLLQVRHLLWSLCHPLPSSMLQRLIVCNGR